MHQEDIPDLANLFLSRLVEKSHKKLDGIQPEAMRRLIDFHWPGNVRELENIVERACALATGPIIGPGDIQMDQLPDRDRSGQAPLLPEGKTLDQWEDELIREAYRRSNGNKSEAARMLGLSRNALRYRLEKIGIADKSSK